MKRRGNRYRHGMTGTRPYMIWAGMLSRCRDKKSSSWERYGGKGIAVCKRWHDFVEFWKDMEPTYFDGASIDRIDNSKGYSPENCRWATRKEQSQNRAVVTWHEWNGEFLPLTEIARRIGVRRELLRLRVHRGMSVEEAINTPLRKPARHKNITKDKNRIKKYRVEIARDGKTIHIGRFENLRDAIKARDDYRNNTHL